MRRLQTIIIPVVLLMLCGFAFPAPKKITLWLIGDSTMSIKAKQNYPETGWGMPFVYFWDSTVTVDNRAQNGRSTRTFMEEKRWEAVLPALQEGDYVFIQFGHNDEVSTKKSYVPEKDFKTYLLQYIGETRSKKAIPVLITPVARRSFDSTGTIRETHAVYAQLVRDIAKEQKTVLIDLDKKSMDLLQKLGPETSKYLFNQLLPGEHPNYPQGVTDNTHFNELGARKMAELVLAEIRTEMPELAKRVK